MPFPNDSLRGLRLPFRHAPRPPVCCSPNLWGPHQWLLQALDSSLALWARALQALLPAKWCGRSWQYVHHLWNRSQESNAACCQKTQVAAGSWFGFAHRINKLPHMSKRHSKAPFDYPDPSASHRGLFNATLVSFALDTTAGHASCKPALRPLNAQTACSEGSAPADGDQHSPIAPVWTFGLLGVCLKLRLYLTCKGKSFTLTEAPVSLKKGMVLLDMSFPSQ